MIDRIIKNKVRIRTIIFLGLFFASYVFTVFYLFGNHDIFGSIVCVFFLFIFAHFLSFDLKKIKNRYILAASILLMLLNILIFLIFAWAINIWLIAAIVAFNFTLFILFFSLRFVQFRSISHFLRGGYLFTLFITITYSFALIGMFQKFPLTCEGLQGASDQLIDFVEKPFRFNFHRNIQADQGDVLITGDMLTGVIADENVNQKVEDVLLKVKNNEVKTDDTLWAPVVTKFNELKSAAVDQIMGQQESYHTGVCDMLLDQINEKYDLNNFKLSAVLLIYLLLFGFVRVAIFIMSFIGFVLFKILYWLGLYKIVKIKKDVDDIV